MVAEPRIRALFFDIDGTLATMDTRRIPDSALEALAAVRERGVKVLIATGRPEPMARWIEDQLVPDGYACANGQFCRLGGRVIRCQHLDHDDVLVARDQVAHGLYAMTVVEDGDWFLSGPPGTVDRGGVGLPVRDAALIGGRPVLQLMLQGGPELDDLLLGATRNLLSVRWTSAFGDIIPRGGGKQVGMQAFLDELGIGRGECAAFGDGANDIAMLEYAGVGVAMGNASDEVKARADCVTTSVEGDGVARALARLGLL
ncbi:MAG: HAD hydrolase family protein [Atopobiaceae bacterium]|jgi:hydroxymethylpyrimidine pyrophosphatase-like HAD family hydrolase|nr:HAD hydrolase family protein [Atopobiaceae bacterium]